MINRLWLNQAPIWLAIILVNNSMGGSEAPQQGRLVLHEFTSKVFNTTRTLRVLLPVGYVTKENSNKRYPVLYLNDGQNLFDVETALFNRMEWRVDEIVDSLVRIRKIEPVIVVGIDNAGKRLRPKEYLPYEDKYLRPPEPSPEGQKYPDFVADEVLPFIQAKYRTRADRGGRAIGGSSYGSLAALYPLMMKPGIFGKALIESPSLYVGEGKVLEDCRQTTTWPEKIYIGVGTNEGNHPECEPGDWDKEAVRDVLKLKKILEDAGLDADRLKVTVEDCAKHNEAAWAKRLPDALQFLFGSD